MSVRFGVTLPQIKRTWDQTREAALEFEQLGFDSLWLNDHLYGVPLPTMPILEAWTTLSAVGAITERVEIGLLVTPVGFRPPAVHAKMAATLDHVTGGRLIVGLGAGWFVQEFEGYGLPFPGVRERLERLEETVEVLRLLWTEDAPSFEGRHYRLDGTHCEPRPSRAIPILIGGGGERRLLRIAARHADVWNNLAVHQGELGRKADVLRAHCREVGRDPSAIAISQQTLVVIGESDSEVAEMLERAKRIYGGHMGDVEAHGLWGTPDRVIDRIHEQASLGASLFVIEFFGKDTRAPARLFAEKVLPAFR